MMDKDKQDIFSSACKKLLYRYHIIMKIYDGEDEIHHMYKEIGLVACLVRITEEYNNLKSLIMRSNKDEDNTITVGTGPIEDSLMNLASLCMATYTEIVAKRKEDIAIHIQNTKTLSDAIKETSEQLKSITLDPVPMNIKIDPDEAALWNDQLSSKILDGGPYYGYHQLSEEEIESIFNNEMSLPEGQYGFESVSSEPEPGEPIIKKHKNPVTKPTPEEARRIIEEMFELIIDETKK